VPPFSYPRTGLVGILACVLVGALLPPGGAGAGWAPLQQVQQTDAHPFDLALNATAALSREGRAVVAVQRQQTETSVREPGIGGWSPLANPPVMTWNFWDYFSAVPLLPLAFDASGTLVAGGLAWGYSGGDLDTDGTWAATAARLAPGAGSWAPEGAFTYCGAASIVRCIATGTAGVGTTGPALSVNDAGRGVLVWRVGPSHFWAGQNSAPGIYAAVRTSSGAWSVPQILAPADAPAPFGLSAAANARGDLAAGWSGPSGSVGLARQPAGGAWTSPTLYAGATAGPTLSAGGNTVAAAWPEGASIRVATSVSGGAWSSAAISGASGARSVLTGVDDAGRVHAVWLRITGGTVRVEHAVRAAGAASFGPITPVAQFAGDGGDFDLNMDAEGDLVIAWTDGQAVTVRRRFAAGGWGPAQGFAQSDGDRYWNVSLEGNRRRDILLMINGYREVYALGTVFLRDTAWTAIYDGSAPRLEGLSVPAQAVAGRPTTVSVAPRDTLSELSGDPMWTFGDGGTGEGRSVSYTYLAGGTYQVTVGQRDAAGNVASETRDVRVTNPVPAVSALAPAAAQAGGGPLALSVVGGGFTPASVVRWNGVARPTSYEGPTLLVADLSAADLSSPGSATVTVSSPAPGGGISSARAFAISAQPVPVIAPPGNVVAPSVAGSLQPGGALTCSPGQWTGDPDTYAFRWLRDGSGIPGAIGPGLVLTDADAGHDVACRITATNAGGSAVALSAPVIVRAPAPTPGGLPEPAAAAGGVTPAPVTTVNPKRTRVGLRAPIRARLGRPVVLRATFAPPVRRAALVVQTRLGGRWVTVARRVVSGGGAVVRTRAAIVGRRPYRMRVRFGGKDWISPVRTVIVLPARR